MLPLPSATGPVVIPPAEPGTMVLLIHAPYPAKLRFDGLPSSLLSASARLIEHLAERGAAVELMDPGTTSEGFYENLERVLLAGSIAGFYPNIQTVLPGTTLDEGLAARGTNLDFYSMPRAPAFAAFEDGTVGYNLLTLDRACSPDRARLASVITAAARRIEGLRDRAPTDAGCNPLDDGYGERTVETEPGSALPALINPSTGATPRTEPGNLADEARPRTQGTCWGYKQERRVSR